MYSSIITGDDVASLNGDCTDVGYALDRIVACLIGVQWYTIYNIYDAFGWQLRLYFFSTSESNPSQVVWDPQIGGVDCETDSENPLCSSSAAVLLPLLFLCLQ